MEGRPKVRFMSVKKVQNNQIVPPQYFRKSFDNQIKIDRIKTLHQSISRQPLDLSYLTSRDPITKEHQLNEIISHQSQRLFKYTNYINLNESITTSNSKFQKLIEKQKQESRQNCFKRRKEGQNPEAQAINNKNKEEKCKKLKGSLNPLNQQQKIEVCVQSMQSWLSLFQEGRFYQMLQDMKRLFKANKLLNNKSNQILLKIEKEATFYKQIQRILDNQKFKIIIPKISNYDFSFFQASKGAIEKIILQVQQRMMKTNQNKIMKNQTKDKQVYLIQKINQTMNELRKLQNSSQKPSFKPSQKPQGAEKLRKQIQKLKIDIQRAQIKLKDNKIVLNDAELTIKDLIDANQLERKKFQLKKDQFDQVSKMLQQIKKESESKSAQINSLKQQLSKKHKDKQQGLVEQLKKQLSSINKALIDLQRQKQQQEKHFQSLISKLSKEQILLKNRIEQAQQLQHTRQQKYLQQQQCLVKENQELRMKIAKNQVLKDSQYLRKYLQINKKCNELQQKLKAKKEVKLNKK